MTAMHMPTLRVAYALTGPTPFARLRKEVDGIFAHWKWSGEVTYRILSFKQAPGEELGRLVGACTSFGKPLTSSHRPAVFAAP